MANIFEKLATAGSSGAVIGQPCVVRDVLDRVGDQWSLLVLSILGDGERRFSQLSREIGDISKQMLSRTLQRLEQDGFVRRTVHPEKPPRVEYALTDMGRSFLGPLEALVTWADMHHAVISESRAAFAERRRELLG